MGLGSRCKWPIESVGKETREKSSLRLPFSLRDGNWMAREGFLMVHYFYCKH